MAAACKMRYVAVLMAIMGAATTVPVRADRNILAPRGLVTNPLTASAEYAFQDTDHRNWLGWVNVGMPQQLLGLELEAESFRIRGQRRETLSAQYSLTGNGFTMEAPAISIGVRDLLNEGSDRQAIFGAMTKSFPLSLRQERVVRDLKVHAGLGTSSLEGPFVGFQARMTLGPTIGAEYVARRINASISFPVAKVLQLKAYTLDKELFWGATLTIRR